MTGQIIKTCSRAQIINRLQGLMFSEGKQLINYLLFYPNSYCPEFLFGLFLQNKIFSFISCFFVSFSIARDLSVPLIHYFWF